MGETQYQKGMICEHLLALALTLYSLPKAPVLHRTILEEESPSGTNGRAQLAREFD